MASWRPGNWKNPYTPEKQADGTWTNAGYTEELDAFEEGADAMLERLRRRGLKLPANTGGLPAPTFKEDGTLVFIPDDEKLPFEP